MEAFIIALFLKRLKKLKTKLELLLEEYGESHTNPTNNFIHWMCVPLIFWSLSGILFLVSLPLLGNLANVTLLIISVYYFNLSKTLWIGMLFFGMACLAIDFYVHFHWYDHAIKIFFLTFLLAWVGQFIGHKIEGKKPSFLKDLQFLLIGPAWLMVKLYKKMGLPY